MKIAIMQPYFFPYIGYFQLMNAVDEFVVYDNIKFTKKGWINRNRILVNGADEFITLPLRKDSDFLEVKDRYLADTWPVDRKKLANRITTSYRKAPHFSKVFPLIEECILFEDRNLFHFIFNSIERVKVFLNIKSVLTISSSVSIDHKLKGEEKVLGICLQQKAGTYINPIGGTDLYNADNFKLHDVTLHFLKSNPVSYTQFNDKFVPWLSMMDVLMFNSQEQVSDFLKNEYSII